MNDTVKLNNISDFRAYKEFDNHEMLIALTDNTTGLRAYVAIHSTRLGPALGGTRFQPYRSEKLAIKDALNLSKAMSYKCALAGLPWGGGKAVVISDETTDKTGVLMSYARMVENLRGLFKTGTDVGISDDDVFRMSEHTSHMLGVSPADRGTMTTSKMAALGVFYSIKSSLKNIFGSDDLKDKKIGIKGVGKLGGELVRLLHEEKAKIIIADVDPKKIEALTKKYPNIKVSNPGEIHKCELDVYSPCALGGEFSRRTIEELQTKIIAGGANNQLQDDELGDLLFSKSILYVPDYIANAGGLIYVSDELEEDGFQQARVLKRVEKIGETLGEVFTLSNKQHLPSHRVANELANKRILENNING